ncbi:MAG: PEP-CTERM sorting domain-containing protein [Pseudomonadota bacterium]
MNLSMIGKGAAIAALSLAATAASATTFIYESNNGTFGGSGGSFSNVTAAYNDANERVTWTVESGVRNGSQMAGAWLVLNDGPNPKQADVNELAIFYMDFVNDRLAVYAYNGQNNANSWLNPGVYLGDYSSNLINSGATQGFSLDASMINDPNPAVPNDGDGWRGVGFGASIGVWFHPVWDLNAAYNADGSINQWSFNRQSWLDFSNRQTRVSEPGQLALFGLGLLGLGALRRRRSA